MVRQMGRGSHGPLPPCHGYDTGTLMKCRQKKRRYDSLLVDGRAGLAHRENEKIPDGPRHFFFFYT